MAERGWPPEQADELFKRLDANADGQISRDELAEAMRRLQADAPTYKELMTIAEPPVGVDFADLATAPGGCMRSHTKTPRWAP